MPRDIAHQGEYDATPSLFAGQKVRARGLRRAADPTPDVDLPRHVDGAQELLNAEFGRKAEAKDRWNELPLPRGLRLVRDLRVELRRRDSD